MATGEDAVSATLASASTPAADELRLRVPPTYVVMLVGVVGLLLGPAIIYFDAASWTAETREFAKKGPFGLWTLIMGAQTLLWTLSLPILLNSLRRHLRDRVPLRKEVIPSAIVLVVLVVAIVVVPAAISAFPSFIPHLHLKVRLITGAALVTALIASTSIWLIRGHMERISGEGATLENVWTYRRLRSELDMLLGFLGAIVGLAVLGSAELREVLLLYAEQPNAQDVDFPAENVILYGLILSFVLALVYVPTHATFHRVGVDFRDALAPCPSLATLEEGLAKRRALDEILGLHVTASRSFRIGTAILSPLIGSVIGVVPKLGA